MGKKLYLAFPEPYLGGKGKTTETGLDLNVFGLPFSYEYSIANFVVG